MKRRSESPKVKLSVSAADNKQQRVVRASCGNVFHQDKIDTDNDRSRQRFINRFAAKVQKNQAKLAFLHDSLVRKAEKADADVEAAAKKAALDMAKQSLPAAPDSRDLSEIDPGRIVRPERFIVPEANGLAVPILFREEGKPTARWMQYIRHKGGQRERRLLSESINLGEAGSLCVLPLPAAPYAEQGNSGWSRTSREAWLKGAKRPSPVELFNALVDRMQWFLDFSSKHADGHLYTLALWTILTYNYHAWPAVPYLSVGGPIGSGKSQVFEVLFRLVFRPMKSSNLTGPALFRTVHDRGGTWLFDEAEKLRRLKDPATADLLSILLAGYKRGGQATRLEPIGDTYRSVSFDVYGPKALACVAGLPAALMSRCIPVPMFRADADSPKPRRRIDAKPTRWQDLRNDLHAVALGYGEMWPVLAKRTTVCPEMNGRDFELWQPLLALADWLDNLGRSGLRDAMTKHALHCIAETRDETIPEADERLLKCLARELQNRREPRASDICSLVKREPGGDYFIEWTDKGVSCRLKSYGLGTRKSRGERRYRLELLPTLVRVANNYGVDLGLTSEATKADVTKSGKGHVGHVGARFPKSGGGRADSNGRMRPAPK